MKLRIPFTNTRKPRKRSRSKQRRLLSEQLENRQLLAGDLLHNTDIPTDANLDGVTTPIDALVIVNRMFISDEISSFMAEGEAGSAAASNEELMVDVNNDGELTQDDALAVLSSLTGEGETALLGLKLDITQNGVSLLRDASGDVTGREADINVGDKFDLEVLVDDLRGPFDSLGAFTVFADIEASSAGAFVPVLSETQIISVSENLVDGTGGDIVISAPGRGSATISFTAFATNQEGSIQSALENDLGYGAGNISVFQTARVPRDTSTDPVTPGDDFQYFIRYVGDSEEFVDVPNVTFDTSGISGATVTSSTTEIPVFVNGDPNQINPTAFQFNIDYRSSSAPDDAIVYANSPSGSFDSTGTDVFDEVGGAGPISPGGIREFVGAANFNALDFEAFSIEVQAVSAIQDLTFQLNLPESEGTALALYGIDEELTPMQIEIDLIDDPNIASDGQGLVVLNFIDDINAVSDSITINEDTSGAVDVLANDTDTTGGTLSATIEAGPANGTVSLNGSIATYTPNADFFGADSFTYLATSTNGGSSVGTVTVAVAAVNDAPVAVNDQLDVSGMDTIDVLANDSAGPNETDNIFVQALGSTTTSQGGTVSIATGDGSVIYTPPSQSFTGTDTFTYTIRDADGAISGSATATLNVTSSLRPLAIDDVVPTDEDVGITFNVVDNDLANTGEQVTFTAFDGTSIVNGTLISNGNGSFTYTPDADFFGTETFSYTINDTSGGTTDATAATGTVTITVASVNDAPTFVADAIFATTEDTSLTINGNATSNDSAGPTNEGQTISIVATSLTTTQGGTATLNNGVITYTPAADFFGQDTFTYTISDGIDNATATATVTVTSVNDAPVAVADTLQGIDEGASATFSTNDLIGNDTGGPSNEAETVTLVSVATTSNLGGAIVDNSDGTFTYTPATNVAGTDTFTYVIQDSNGTPLSATGVVTIAVADIPANPIANDDTITVIEDTAFTSSITDLLGNDTDDDGNNTISLQSFGSTRAVDNGDGTFTYTPVADAFGTAADTFTYTIVDNTNRTSTATVTVNITSVNDAPVAVNDTASIDEGDIDSIIDVLANDNAGGGETQTLSIDSLGSATTTAGGTVTISADGLSVIYNPPNSDFSGTDTFTYVARDSGGAVSSSATVTITVVDDGIDPVATSSVSGVVFSDSNGNNTNDAGEAVAGVQLRLTLDSDGSEQFVTTGADGSYVIENLVAGQYTLEQVGSSAFASSAPATLNVGVAEAVANQDLPQGSLQPQFVFNRLFTTLVQPVGSDAWNEAIAQINQAAIDGNA